VTEIIPTILVKTQEEAMQRIKIIEGRLPWMQIDVVDGKFAPNITWSDPDFIKMLDTAIRFEIDLMVVDPEIHIKQWSKAIPRIGRIYFHQETAGNRTHIIIDQIQKVGIEAGMSINPKTRIDVLYPFAKRLDAVLLLGVEPGFNAAPFNEKTIKKVQQFHKKFPELPITVDGGVKPRIAKKLVEAGATRLAVGSFIWNGTNPLIQLKALQEDIQQVDQNK